jgi:hypothetical protein
VDHTVQDAFEPRLAGPLIGSREKLLIMYRWWSPCRLGRHIAAMRDLALLANDPNDLVRGEIRLMAVGT